MSGFTKLFNSILYSTIWQEPNATRILWITMLAMSDKNGEVMASVPGLAKTAGITIPECRSGLETLMSPDPDSRTKDHDGRRIEEVDGGWNLLNHGKYRQLLSAEERREYNRKKQAETRERTRRAIAEQKSKPVNDVSMTVNDNKQCQHISEAEGREQSTNPLSKNPLSGVEGEATEKKKSDHRPSTPVAKKIADLYNRKHSTPWTAKEIKAFKTLFPLDPEELDLACRYTEAQRAKGDDGRHRRDLATFLNNFTTEVDRAREWEKKPASKSTLEKETLFGPEYTSA